MWLVLLAVGAVLIFLKLKVQLFNLKRLKKDFRVLKSYFLIFYHITVRYKLSVCDNFDKIVAAHPQKELFYFEDELWTSSKIKEEANRISLYFETQGYQKGDVVALMYDNCPEYMCLWLGLAQIGVVTALINTNVVKDGLVHSLKVSQSKAIICGSNYGTAVCEVIKHVNNIKVYQLSNTLDDVLPFNVDMRKKLQDIEPCTFERKLKLRRNDCLMYIFTSGTTGMPKAAVLTHERYRFLTALGLLIPTNSVVYCPMPLYHGSGVAIGAGQAIVWGQTVVLKKKFSASNYWSDCIMYRCNVAQYIGEMCRYILSASGDTKIKHPVKIMLGNGLKPQIWKEFITKFGIEQIMEGYGSTEGNATLINVTNTFGSVGHVPVLLKPIFPLTVVKFDEATGDPLRNEHGRCIPSAPKEPGILIGKIIKGMAMSEYTGYANEDDTNKKILRDVFRLGDRYFNTGDVFEVDEEGNFYFLDRIGDTFRWKGENVSTCEVEGIISNLIRLSDAVVFGVKIGDVEGRAGMAAIVCDNITLDIDQLLEGLRENLPSYAIPLFIRVMDKLPITSTCKLQKVKLQNEGFDVNIVNDNIYFYDSRDRKYVILTKELHNKIIQHELKL